LGSYHIQYQNINYFAAISDKRSEPILVIWFRNTFEPLVIYYPSVEYRNIDQRRLSFIYEDKVLDWNREGVNNDK